jgi:hypothetical protein
LLAKAILAGDLASYLCPELGRIYFQVDHRITEMYICM